MYAEVFQIFRNTDATFLTEDAELADLISMSAAKMKIASNHRQNVVHVLMDISHKTEVYQIHFWPNEDF